MQIDVGLGGKPKVHFFIYFEAFKLIKSGQNPSLDRTGHHKRDFLLEFLSKNLFEAPVLHESQTAVE